MQRRHKEQWHTNAILIHKSHELLLQLEHEEEIATEIWKVSLQSDSRRSRVQCKDTGLQQVLKVGKGNNMIKQQVQKHTLTSLWNMVQSEQKGTKRGVFFLSQVRDKIDTREQKYFLYNKMVDFICSKVKGKEKEQFIKKNVRK